MDIWFEREELSCRRSCRRIVHLNSEFWWFGGSGLATGSECETERTFT